MHARPSEKVALIACIDPDQYGTGELNTAGTAGHVIDMSKWHEVMVVVSVGDMETSATVTIHIESGADTAATTTTIKEAEALADGTDDNTQIIMNVRSDELGADDHRYLNVEIVVGTDSVDLCCNVFGLEPRIGPGSDDDLSSVVIDD